MRVYVGTYAKYNSGSIKGEWLDLEDYSDKEEFFEACKELHSDEEDPEFMFQDWENIPAGMISASHIDEEAFEVAQMDDDDRELMMVYRGHVIQDGSFEEARDAFYGKYDNPEDFAQSLIEETTDLREVPQFLLSHIDWEGVARDLSYDGFTYVRKDGETWVFRA